jgi:hypothetical protein
MIKQGILNYFKNLKYFFTPLGTVALGFVIGLSVLIPGIGGAASDFTERLTAVLSESSIDFSALQESVTQAVRALNWNDPLDALRTMFSAGWLTDTLNGCVDALIESSAEYTVQIGEAVAAFAGAAVTYFCVLVLFVMIGLIGGYFLTKWLIRRNIAKRPVRKYLLVSFVDSLITATLVALCVWLFSIWKPSILISSVLSLLLFGGIALFEAHLAHGWKKVDVRRIVNAQNIVKLFLTDVLILLSAWACTALIALVANMPVGVFVGIALMQIAFIVVSLNAEAYVKSVADGMQA